MTFSHMNRVFGSAPIAGPSVGVPEVPVAGPSDNCPVIVSDEYGISGRLLIPEPAFSVANGIGDLGPLIGRAGEEGVGDVGDRRCVGEQSRSDHDHLSILALDIGSLSKSDRLPLQPARPISTPDRLPLHA
jgi:hypothetical protein